MKFEVLVLVGEEVLAVAHVQLDEAVLNRPGIKLVFQSHTGHPYHLDEKPVRENVEVLSFVRELGPPKLTHEKLEEISRHGLDLTTADPLLVKGKGDGVIDPSLLN